MVTYLSTSYLRGQKRVMHEHRDDTCQSFNLLLKWSFNSFRVIFSLFNKLDKKASIKNTHQSIISFLDLFRLLNLSKCLTLLPPLLTTGIYSSFISGRGIYVQTRSGGVNNWSYNCRTSLRLKDKRLVGSRGNNLEWPPVHWIYTRTTVSGGG